MRPEGEKVIDDTIDYYFIYTLNAYDLRNRCIIKDLLLNTILLLDREVRSHFQLG